VKHVDLGSCLLRAASKYGPRPFVVTLTGSRSYDEVADRSLRFASGLAAIGLAPGDRVGVVLHNIGEYVEILFGASLAGVVVVPINRRLGAKEVHAILQGANAKALVTEPHFRELTELLADQSGVQVVHVGVGSATAVSYESLLSTGPIDPVPVRDEDLHSIYFTSGTTSVQKGVLRSHGSNFAMAIGGSVGTPFEANDAALYAIPMHSAGFYALGLAAMLAGARLALVPDFDEAELLAIIARERVTHLTLVPTMWEMLLNSTAAATSDVSSIRHPLWGGMPLLPVTADRLEDWLPTPCVGTYGLTEATCSTYSNEQIYRSGRRDSSGVPAATMEVQVLDELGERRPPGEYGEVVLRGTIVMDGYLNLPDLTAQTLIDGWLHTGDYGRVDEDGALTVVSRKKDMIISGGENIYPLELESSIATIPGVTEVAVVGVPDPLWGQSVQAFVVGDPSLRAEDVIEHCMEHHAAFKKPRRVVFVDELPKNALGKVLKNELVDS
jgi:acyl-CoA synthetase (AMP-forming)/AMP-acid ligase II